MQNTYNRLLGISVKFTLLIIGFTILAVMLLYGNAERDVAAVEEYMEGTVLLNFLVVGAAKGTLIFMKIFLVLAAIVIMLLHLFLHLVARLLQSGEPEGWRNQASLVCVIVAFLLELILFVVSLLASFGNYAISIAMALIIFADAYSEVRIWKDGKASTSNQQ